MARPRKRVAGLDSNRATIISSAIGLVSAVAVVVITQVVNTDPPKLSAPCVEIAKKYADLSAEGAERRALVVLGVDGASIMTGDPEAEACGLKPEMFEPINRPAAAVGPAPNQQPGS